MITTVQCSICSQLNDKPRVVVTYFRLHHIYLQYNNIIHFTHSLPSCPPSLTINNTQIEFVFSHRDLGVAVTNNLSWSIHYNHICSKAYAALNLIRRTITTSSINVKKWLYLSLVRSQLWRPRLLKDITQLERVQRRATKYIVQDRNQDYKSRLIALQLLPLMYWFELLDIMFLVKCINQMNHSIFLTLSRSQLPTPAVAPAAINCNSDSIQLLIIGISILIALCTFGTPFLI